MASGCVFMLVLCVVPCSHVTYLVRVGGITWVGVVCGGGKKRVGVDIRVVAVVCG
jgi:hypothetical protein